jgi:hypothetical protein
MLPYASGMPTRPALFALSLALLVAGCVGGGDRVDSAAAVEGALDAASSQDASAPKSDKAPAASEGDPANATEPDAADAKAEDATVDEAESSETQPTLVTKVHEREGDIEPFTYVGGGELLGYGEDFFEFRVPPNTMAVRAMLFWNGTDGLDLSIWDDTTVCSGYVGIATCQVDFVTKAETQGRHWAIGSSQPATLTFDAAAVRAGCPDEPCAWYAIAYSEGDVGASFHLIVEVDTLEP